MHKKSLGQERKCLESYESIALRLAEDDNAFLCDIHRPYKLDIIMIKPFYHLHMSHIEFYV